MGIRKCVCRTAYGVLNGMRSVARGVMPGALVGSAGGDLRVDVSEGADDMVVVADIPGIGPENVAVRLLSPPSSGSRARAAPRRPRAPRAARLCAGS